jgi:hypothetical protein
MPAPTRGVGLLCFALSVFAADPAVTLENPAVIELSPRLTQVRVLLKYEGSMPPVLQNPPLVDGVELGGVPKNVAGFSAVWANKSLPLAIDLTLNPHELVQAGTYDLFIEVQPKTRLKLQVTHPAPKLQPVPKLIIDRTYWFIGVNTDTHPELPLHESSNKSDLTVLAIVPAINTILNAQPIGGTLNVRTPDKAISHGGDLKIAYTVANEFGIGTASGTMRVDAEELTDPAGTFDFEVHSHVHWIYIGITILGGLVLSYFLKVFLQQKIELEQARVDAQKLAEQIRQEETRHADTDFLNSYQHELQLLDAALAQSDPAAINTAKTTLDNVWRTQLQELAKRHQTQLDELNRLLDVVNYDWPVPPTVAEPIAKARHDQVEVRAAIERDDLRAAEQARMQIVIRLGSGIANNAIRWQTAAAQVLRSLSQADRGLSPAVEEGFSKPAQDTADALKRIDPTTTIDSPTKMMDVLASVRAERLSVIQVLDYLKDAVEKELATAQSAVNRQKPPHWNMDAFRGALEPALERFTGFLKTIADKPDLQIVPSRLDEMHEGWTSALQKQFPGGNSDIDEQLAANKYLDALQTAIQAKRAAAARGAEAYVAPMPISFTAPAFSPGAGGAPVAVHSIRTTFQTLFTPAPVLPTLVTAEAQLKKDKLTQSLIVGFVLLIAGYGLQLNSFVGTFTDFSTLFFWAFGLDLTVDAISKATKKSA